MDRLLTLAATTRLAAPMREELPRVKDDAAEQ
jgi:hypothetical protein